MISPILFYKKVNEKDNSEELSLDFCFMKLLEERKISDNRCVLCLARANIEETDDSYNKKYDCKYRQEEETDEYNAENTTANCSENSRNSKL